MSDGLCLKNLRLALQGRVLFEVNFSVRPGEVQTVMGPSGVGKSTLLAAILGTLGPEFQVTGQIMLNGRDVTHMPPQARRIGLMFQDHLLFPHMSVAQNLAFGLPADAKTRKQVIQEALESIDLKGFEARDPATLSGGQRARVALMRTLLAAPDALLLDEPFSRLDDALKAQMRRLVFSRAQAAKLPILLVTHDPADAEAAGGAVLTLKAR